MKHLNFYLLLLLSLLAMGCSNDNDDSNSVKSRTVMVYFNAENNLSSFAAEDFEELVEGSKDLADNCNLLVFVDAMSNPVIYKVKNGEKEVLKSYETDIDASDKDNMLEVFQTMVAACPADEYATVFWGHGDGPIISKSPHLSTNENEPTSYGADHNSNKSYDFEDETWIDIPELASVMKQLPKQEFILFEACCMQNIEVAYELRHSTKYIIGATSETPSFGAPYQTTTKIFGYSDVESACKMIVDDYQGNNNQWEEWRRRYKINNVCMSVIKTAEMESLLTATKEALNTISGSKPLEVSTTFPADSHEATSCIYYYKTDGEINGYPILYDMNDVMLHNLSAADYKNWKDVFDKVVIYRPNTGDIRDTGNCDWFGGDTYDTFIITTKNFRSFYLSDETFGGVSMFFPKSEYKPQYTNMNTRMYDYEWCREVGWKDLGW